MHTFAINVSSCIIFVTCLPSSMDNPFKYEELAQLFGLVEEPTEIDLACLRVVESEMLALTKVVPRLCTQQKRGILFTKPISWLKSLPHNMVVTSTPTTCDQHCMYTHRSWKQPRPPVINTACTHTGRGNKADHL